MRRRWAACRAENAGVKDYYDKRAAAMEAAYQGEPPAWVLAMVADMQAALRGRRVLEVACGTGHWTRFAAEAAVHVTAMDAAPRMLELARAKDCGATFVEGDAYRLADIPGEFNAGLAMQWFSHIPRTRIGEFLTGWHRRIGPGAPVFLAANQVMPYTSTFGKPGTDDTFEERELGCKRCVSAKNYFTAADLHAILAPYAADVVIHEGVRWWWLTYRVRE